MCSNLCSQFFLILKDDIDEDYDANGDNDDDDDDDNDGNDDDDDDDDDDLCKIKPANYPLDELVLFGQRRNPGHLFRATLVEN